jgi:hypothetical protein
MAPHTLRREKMKTIMIIVMLVFATQSYAADKWSAEDKTLALLFTTATVIDWGQTRDIVKNNKDKCVTYYDSTLSSCNKLVRADCFRCKCDYAYHETNIYLGKRPSMGEVDTYMPLAILATLGIAHVLPEKYRSKFLYGMSFLELGTIYNNKKIGLKINF